MITQEQREVNINKVLDFAFGHCQEHGIDMKTMNRKRLNDIMFDYSIDAEIPFSHFELAFMHQIATLNGTPSTILQSNKKQIIMKNPISPMLPMELTILDKPDEPTTKGKRQRIRGIQKIDPYLSPLNFQK